MLNTINVPIGAHYWCSIEWEGMEGGVGVEENHLNTKNAPYKACFSCSGCQMGCGGTAGKGGRVLVLEYMF